MAEPTSLTEAEWLDFRTMALKVLSEVELTDEEEARWADYEERMDVGPSAEHS